MKPEAQRIAIAEACGFKRHGNGEHWASFGGSIAGYVDNALTPIPNYLKDLNAMHEAENVLSALQQPDYAKTLRTLAKCTRHWAHEMFDTAHATASQRAEAFLRTLGLWIEGGEA